MSAAYPAISRLAAAAKGLHLSLALDRQVCALAAVRAHALCLLQHGPQRVVWVKRPEGGVEVRADEDVIALV